MNAHRQLTRRLALFSLLSLVFVTTAAFTCGPEFEDPCDDDRFACDDGGEFTYLESCDLTGDLAVEVGHGESSFNTFDSAPQVYSGGQGGQHAFFGVRIGNADLTRYDKLLLDIEIRANRECYDFEMMEPPCFDSLGSRELILGAAEALQPGDDGVIEITGLLIQLGFGASDDRTVTATVEDPCQRTGTATATWPQ